VRFRTALLLITLGGVALRIVYVLATNDDFAAAGDARFYHETANLLVDGKGFVSPFFSDRTIEAAEHPPLYSILLAVPSLIGFDTVLGHRVFSCLLGAGIVFLTGLVGRRVAGERAGLIAAGIAALYPNVWSPDTMLQAETASTLATIAAVFLAYRYLDAPSIGRLTAVGAVAGLGALARSELLLLAFVLVGGLVMLTKDVPNATRMKWVGAGLVTPLLLIAPWSIYNATRFEHPILLSGQIDPLLASANCESVYYGPLQGYYDINCAAQIAAAEGIDESYDQSEEGVVYRREALEYIGDHLDRLPNVVGVRLLRIVGLYKPTLYVNMDSFIEGRDRWVSRTALYSFYLLALLAVAGGVTLRKRRDVSVFPLLAPIAVVLVTVIVTYASTRFRAAAEPVLCVLAAAAVDALFRRQPAERN
jgi:4-amino-4-deoxy-L-arabinose transferase-like glycosyltransferase